MENKKWYQSANFYIALVLAIGGFFVGFPEGAAGDAVAAIFGLIGSGGAIYQFFKSRPERKGKSWFADANFWNYAGAVIVSIVPTYGGELVEPLKQTLTALIGGNWNGVIIGAVSLATILFKLFKKPTPG